LLPLPPMSATTAGCSWWGAEMWLPGWDVPPRNQEEEPYLDGDVLNSDICISRSKIFSVCLGFGCWLLL
jgi:hypothetical protein